MFILSRYLLNKVDISNNVVKLKFSENTLNELILNKIGKPTSKDEIRYYKNKLNKLSPLIFNKLKPKVKLIAKTANFEKFPNIKIPEICVYGGHNVGKSCFINSLLNKVNLCNTNRKTNELHFYQVGKPGIVLLVDMPGYDIESQNTSENDTVGDDTGTIDNRNDTFESQLNPKADTNKNNLKKADKINEICLGYLKYRTNLILIVILVDTVKGICKEDLEVINYCNFNKLKFMVVLNKCDLIKPVELTKKIQVINNQLNIFKHRTNNLIPISSLKLQNLNQLRDVLFQVVSSYTYDDSQEDISKSEMNNLKTKLSNINNKSKISKIDGNNINEIIGDGSKDSSNLTKSSTSSILLGNVGLTSGSTNNLLTNFNQNNKLNGILADESEPKILNINTDDNLIKLNLSNLSIINTKSIVSKNDLDNSVSINNNLDNGLNKDINKNMNNNSLVQEKIELYNKKKLYNHLKIRYKVSKFKINRSYKRVFSLFKSKLLKNRAIIVK